VPEAASSLRGPDGEDRRQAAAAAGPEDETVAWAGREPGGAGLQERARPGVRAGPVVFKADGGRRPLCPAPRTPARQPRGRRRRQPWTPRKLTAGGPVPAAPDRL